MDYPGAADPRRGLYAFDRVRLRGRRHEVNSVQSNKNVGQTEVKVEQQVVARLRNGLAACVEQNA